MPRRTPPEQPRLALIWTHRIDLTDPAQAIHDVAALSRIPAADPVDVHVGHTSPWDYADPARIVHTLALAGVTRGHTLNLVGPAGNVRTWWDALREAAEHDLTNRERPPRPPRLRIVHGKKRAR